MRAERGDKNGKEYQLPLIDQLVFPIIPDVATQIAALRTGMIDWSTDVPLVYSDTLTATSPSLIQVPNPVTINVYWPWLKNYYSELEGGTRNFTPMTSRLWIDQDLKAAMGY